MYDQIIVLKYESACFRINITCSTLWDTVDDNCYATTKTSKIEKMNEKKARNPTLTHLSALCACLNGTLPLAAPGALTHRLIKLVEHSWQPKLSKS